MRFAALRSLVGRQTGRGAASSIFGVLVGVSSLVFFVALGLGVGRVVREKIFPVDASLVEVIPSQLSLGPLSGKLEQATVDRLAALPHVTHAFRKMSVRVPAASVYDGDFFGQRLRMGVEIVAVGVDPGLVEADVAPGTFEDRGEGQPLPTVISSRLIELYNKTFAPTRNLPQLSAQLIGGFTFPVEFNRSFIVAAPAGPVIAARAQVAGVSDRGLLAGLMVPLAAAQRLNRQARVDADTFTAVVLQAESPDAVPSVAAEVKAMGLRVDDKERRLAENTGAAVAVTTAALGLLSLLICVLAAFNITHALSAQVRARERELAVMRAVGASKRDLTSLVLAEAAVLGLAGGVGGSAIAVLGALVVDMLSAHVLPEFPFKPESYFLWPWWLPVAGVALGLASAAFGAWWPAQRAAAIDPARALAGQG
jgi:ABC-type lipoprotein release transport system permease subunit